MLVRCQSGRLETLRLGCLCSCQVPLLHRHSVWVRELLSCHGEVGLSDIGMHQLMGACASGGLEGVPFQAVTKAVEVDLLLLVAVVVEHPSDNTVSCVSGLSSSRGNLPVLVER
jgi:hypothetical protein